MSNKVKTVRLQITQEGGFNFMHEVSTTGAVDVNNVTRAFVNKLFQLIEIKKRRGGVTFKSLKLNKEFMLTVSGAIQFKAGSHVLSQKTNGELPIKFKSAMYKESPDAARKDMVDAVMSIVEVVGDERTLIQLADNKPVKINVLAEEIHAN